MLLMLVFRNTSAHAEKTSKNIGHGLCNGKHIRSRGENVWALLSKVLPKETPPLTRRKHCVSPFNRLTSRNTSAHAEKTYLPRIRGFHAGKHLRSRGENGALWCCAAFVMETPPLTRRKRDFHAFRLVSVRNTSAHAEKTSMKSRYTELSKKHLRSRGENLLHLQRSGKSRETPPLTRRKLSFLPLMGGQNGNTSAHAEKTAYRSCQ